MTFKEVQESLERIRSDYSEKDGPINNRHTELRCTVDNLIVSKINQRKARVNFQTYLDKKHNAMWSQVNLCVFRKDYIDSLKIFLFIKQLKS